MKIERSVAEMVAELRLQLKLLAKYTGRMLKEGHQDYIQEVAAKLRLLAVNAGSNVALLPKLMRGTGIEIRDRTPARSPTTHPRGPLRNT